MGSQVTKYLATAWLLPATAGPRAWSSRPEPALCLWESLGWDFLGLGCPFQQGGGPPLPGSLAWVQQALSFQSFR